MKDLETFKTLVDNAIEARRDDDNQITEEPTEARAELLAAISSLIDIKNDANKIATALFALVEARGPLIYADSIKWSAAEHVLSEYENKYNIVIKDLQWELKSIQY
jgi:hypothetical protein